jgi:hypothetical protein
MITRKVFVRGAWLWEVTLDGVTCDVLFVSLEGIV